MTVSRCTDRAAKASIYRKAARRIECDKDQYSCVAIANAPGGSAAMAETYADVFAYGLEDPENEWETSAGKLQIKGFSESAFEGYDTQSMRVLALCFMAAITERP